MKPIFSGEGVVEEDLYAPLINFSLSFSYYEKQAALINCI
jgi:hypothetical protein